MTVCSLDEYPECKAIHCSMLPANPTPFSWLFGAPLLLLPTRLRNYLGSFLFSADELAGLARLKWFWSKGSGYFLVQRTKPSKIGLALYDHPVGILAWIGELWLELSEPPFDSNSSGGGSKRTPGEEPKSTRSKTELYDDLCSTVALYHLSQSFHTSVLPYAQFDPSWNPAVRRAKLGYSIFPYDAGAVPKSWCKRTHPGLCWTRKHEQGGHFREFQPCVF